MRHQIQQTGSAHGRYNTSAACTSNTSSSLLVNQHARQRSTTAVALVHSAPRHQDRHVFDCLLSIKLKSHNKAQLTGRPEPRHDHLRVIGPGCGPFLWSKRDTIPMPPVPRTAVSNSARAAVAPPKRGTGTWNKPHQTCTVIHGRIQLGSEDRQSQSIAGPICQVCASRHHFSGSAHIVPVGTP